MLPQPLTCTVCTDGIVTEAGVPGPINIENCPVCRACLARLFELSIANEASFPPHWGDKILDPHDYLRHQAYNTLFLKRFEERENEFSCPARERVYCAAAAKKDSDSLTERCGQFVGRLKSKKTYASCGNCKAYTCLKCKALVESPQGNTGYSEQEVLDKLHPSCTKLSSSASSSKADAEALETAFQGLKRGKDYQICPNPSCGIRVELAEACNHLTCASCKTEFCFICGRRAVMGQGHWAGGVRKACPLYGQPRKGNMIFEDGRAEFREEHGPMDEFERWQLELLQQHDGRGYERQTLRPTAALGTRVTEGQARQRERSSLGRGVYNPAGRPGMVLARPDVALHIDVGGSANFNNSSRVYGNRYAGPLPIREALEPTSLLHAESMEQQQRSAMRVHDWPQDQPLPPPGNASKALGTGSPPRNNQAHSSQHSSTAAAAQTQAARHPLAAAKLSIGQRDGRIGSRQRSMDDRNMNVAVDHTRGHLPGPQLPAPFGQSRSHAYHPSRSIGGDQHGGLPSSSSEPQKHEQPRKSTSTLSKIGRLFQGESRLV